jgi:ABC-type branched-subunit amino acid transport system permease subunit
VLAIVLFILERVRTSPFGRALRAIREDAQVAAFAGKDVLTFKVKAFAIGGALAGLAGALYAHYSSYIVPEIYVPLLTIYIFLALTAGGIGNNWGAVFGAFVVVFFPRIDALPRRRHSVALGRAARRAARIPGRSGCCWCCSSARAGCCRSPRRSWSGPHPEERRATP